MTDEHEQPGSGDRSRAPAADGTQPEPDPAETEPEATQRRQAPDRPGATAEELRRPDPGGLLGPEVDPGEQSGG